MAKTDWEALARLRNTLPPGAAPVEAPDTRVEEAPRDLPGSWEDHAEEILQFCRAGVTLVGEARFAALLDRGVNWDSGRDVDAVIGALDRAVDSLPLAEGDRLARMLGQVARRKGVPTRAGDLRAAQDALPYLADYVAAERAAERAAAAIEPPAALADESVSDYRARLEEWAASYSPDQLRRAGVDIWALADAQRERLRAAEQAREQAQKARLAAAYAAYAREYDAGRAPWPEGYNRLDLPGLEPEDYAHSFEARDACAGTARAWAEARPDLKGEAPPQGWGDLPWSAIARLALRYHGRQASYPGAISEAQRRLSPAEGEAVAKEGLVVWRDGFARQGQIPEGTWALQPHPAGWVETKGGDDAAYYGPEVYSALQRVLAAPRGAVDVSRVIGYYGRHPTKRFPRFAFCAWKTWGLVGIDDALGGRLDDLRALKDADLLHRIPRDAWWIDATIRTTDKGFRLVSGRGDTSPTALVVVATGTSSNGRHGISGSISTPRSDSPAPAVTVFGGSGGGGQHRAVCMAAVSEGRPLLLTSGAGYALRGERMFYVPGLAEGRPGKDKEV